MTLHSHVFLLDRAQPNGTRVRYRLFGDEKFNYAADLGKSIMFPPADIFIACD